MTVSGVDVSSYQPTAYSTKGLDFVFIKVTQGLSYTNPKWTAQVATARKADLLVGFYHYPTIANSAQAEADHFLATVGSHLQAGDVLCLDWEWYGQKVSDQQARAYKAAFLSRLQVKQPKHRRVLYSDVANWTTVDTDSNCGDALWIATGGKPAGKPGIKHPWTFHQYSTAGNLDHDVANFASPAALRTWAMGLVPKPPPRPAPNPKPAGKPKVSLKNLIAAAKADPKGKQGHTTHPADVRPVEAALHAEGLLAAQYAKDGSFGTATVAAYSHWQERCGYRGVGANGIPGKTSLAKLGAKHNFTVTT